MRSKDETENFYCPGILKFLDLNFLPAKENLNRRHIKIYLRKGFFTILDGRGEKGFP